ncbi:alpha/beta fold hydrolase [Pontibacter sp. G13]|uniref:alpha/beta hydrolase n=1 Tax=Pontibacter sp. G13 TaxID=3074898 RepID=UPI00288958A4|nr:alpha/beta fold hydrolase [Pontibacter sp. G13]WNJ20604.1 alpha/beta fold hydrolase [Pontibacter sp. G13]
MKSFLLILLVLVAVLGVVFALGPRVPTPTLSPESKEVSIPLNELSDFIQHQESQVQGIRAGNQSQIFWVDSVRKTKTVVLYLHGFSASPEEGRDAVQAFGERYGANIFLPRLQAHGVDEPEPMLKMSADGLLQSAEDAYQIAKTMGDHVVIMATSTGGSLALLLAQRHPEIAGLILYSPNIRVKDARSSIMLMPWGLQIGKAVNGGAYLSFEPSDYSRKYWTYRYRIEAAAQMLQLLDNGMIPETFAQVNQPTFVGCYYQDVDHQDQVVSVPAIQKMVTQLGTPKDQLMFIEFPDAKEHVICNPHISKDYPSVMEATYEFADEILKLPLSPSASDWSE